MPKATSRDPIYRGRRFPPNVIEQCVRWYVTYRLSYRDLVAIMAEQGVAISHTTVMRWVLRYVPEFEQRWTRFARPSARSWRMDETVLKVGGVQHWVYRAVDRYGKSVHSLLSNVRTIDAATAFFQGAVAQRATAWPTTINLDGNRATHQASRELGRVDGRWLGVNVRANRYVNNLIEQDHRAIKRRCAAMHGLKSFQTAAITIAGVELSTAGRSQPLSLKDHWSLALNTAREPVALMTASNPPMHQFSANYEPIRAQPRRRRYSRRHPLRVPYGQGLFLLVMPSGGRYWRYNYRCRGTQKTLTLGVYPAVGIERAKLRHAAARKLVRDGIDPATKRQELRYVFAQSTTQRNADLRCGRAR